ncbi:MAG: hypothetical protein K6G67_06225 [Lachnospiraceae bacterium]|nr:hypothetical protein [Lachnospiraceae bacterium]
MEIIINNYNLGSIEDGIVEKICEKYAGENIADIAIDFMHRLVEDSNNMSIDELIKHAKFRKNCFDYDTIADMISDHMKSDLRPINEICKNCDKYYDRLCLDILMEVDPFTKGSSCWVERKERSNVTDISIGYAEYGKEDAIYETSFEETRTVEEPREKIVSFRRPRWIIREGDNETMSIDEINNYVKHIMSRDSDELRAESDKSAAEEEVGLEITTEEKNIISSNMSRFIEISGHLYSIWRTARKHGISSIRNVLEETEESDDKLIAYINERAKEAIDGDLIENIPPDPLDNTIDSILISYANFALMSLVAGHNINRVKAIIKCFVDGDIYEKVMERIVEYTNRYFWIQDEN